MPWVLLPLGSKTVSQSAAGERFVERSSTSVRARVATNTALFSAFPKQRHASMGITASDKSGACEEARVLATPVR